MGKKVYEGPNFTDQKKSIKKITDDFEKRMCEARNEFELAIVFLGMFELMQLENLKLSEQIELLELDSIKNNESLIMELKKRRAENTEFGTTVANEFNCILPKALQIQQAMLNCHKLKEAQLINQEL